MTTRTFNEQRFLTVYRRIHTIEEEIERAVGVGELLRLSAELDQLEAEWEEFGKDIGMLPGTQ